MNESAGTPRNLLLVAAETKRFQVHVENLEMFQEFRIQKTGTWRGALQEMARSVFDLIMVDYHLCEAGGAAVCHCLREHDKSIPIIVFANEFSKTELVLCLDSGANDYVTVADDPVVISARVRAQIRTRIREGHQRTKVGKFWFMRDQRMLMGIDGSRPTRLTPREADLLSYLAQHANRPVGVGDLYQKVWHYRGPVNSHTVQTHIYRLRQKIEADPSTPTILVSRGSGYCLVVSESADRALGMTA